jgi:hypothetical protein
MPVRTMRICFQQPQICATATAAAASVTRICGGFGQERGQGYAVQTARQVSLMLDIGGLLDIPRMVVRKPVENQGVSNGFGQVLMAGAPI